MLEKVARVDLERRIDLTRLLDRAVWDFFRWVKTVVKVRGRTESRTETLALVTSDQVCMDSTTRGFRLSSAVGDWEYLTKVVNLEGRPARYG